MLAYRPGSRIRSPVSGIVYELGECLGEGGFGTVCGARPIGESLETEVCMKVTDDQASWHREVYFGGLVARNVRAIRLFEAFPHFAGGRAARLLYCLVFERAKHGALAQWLTAGPQPWSEAKIKQEVGGLLRLLDQLHGGAALHRDVTPFNVFVCDGERLKLGDFGIAQHWLGKKKGVVADTVNLAWAPPAIAVEAQRNWRATDDIYQIGQLLAVLVRRDVQPITTESVRTLRCSNDLRGVIRRAIGDRPERYRDALEMLAAIQTPREVSTGGVSSLRGKLVVFTGPLSVSRAEATRSVLRMGGRVGSKVTGTTHVLVRGPSVAHLDCRRSGSEAACGRATAGARQADPNH